LRNKKRNYLPPSVFRQKRVGFVAVEDKFFEVMQSIMRKNYQKQPHARMGRESSLVWQK